MNVDVCFDFITGFAVGIEFVQAESEGSGVFIYLGIFEIAFLWD